MKYLPPFGFLKAQLTISAIGGELEVSCGYETLLLLIKKLLVTVDVDEKWYLEKYEDIAHAISQGTVASARTHFVNDGYFEGRVPFEIKIDERFYLAQNAGVADCVRQGVMQSGQQHFDENGYQEGRLPFGL